MSALKIICKAGLSFEGELVCRRSCMFELNAVVWSLAESWLGGDELLTCPWVRVIHFNPAVLSVVVSWLSVLVVTA